MIGRRWSLTDLPDWARLPRHRMPLDLSQLDSVVRIIGDLPDPSMRTGQRRGVLGTGFLCAVPSRNINGLRYPYVVTAHHVIEDQNRLEVQALVPLSRGMELQAPVEIRDWIQPLENVDLALARFAGPLAGSVRH